MSVFRARTWIAGVVPLLVAGTPRLASACAVCSAATEDETRQAFLLTTALLTVLPLALIGSLIWWLRRRARELEQLSPDRDPRFTR